MWKYRNTEELYHGFLGGFFNKVFPTKITSTTKIASTRMGDPTSKNLSGNFTPKYYKKVRAGNTDKYFYSKEEYDSFISGETKKMSYVEKEKQKKSEFLKSKSKKPPYIETAKNKVSVLLGKNVVKPLAINKNQPLEPKETIGKIIKPATYDVEDNKTVKRKRK